MAVVYNSRPRIAGPDGKTTMAHTSSWMAAALVLTSACLAATPDVPFTHGKAADGAAKTAVCSSCHGPNGNSSNPDWPRLAGQNAVYIAEQLRLFRSGARDNPVMKPLAATLQDQDIDDIAVYYEAQTPTGWRPTRPTGRPARRCTSTATRRTRSPRASPATARWAAATSRPATRR